MARITPLTERCSLILPDPLAERLLAHLFPGDGDEHGAVLVAGLARGPRGIRLLGRELFLARDGKEYVRGERGYRMLTGAFVTEKILYCRDEGLCYLAIHNHGGTDAVGFSPDDLASHERGYPALLKIARGQPVGALVFARNAVAGDVWFSTSHRMPVAETRIMGPSIRRLYAAPPHRPRDRDATYDRQARFFGDAGQDLLARTTVGIIGAGGAGSLLVEYLARLGVGHLIVADPDRIKVVNLPRNVGATRWDARGWLTGEKRPPWLRRLGERVAATKVAAARRVAHQANPRVVIEPIFGDITHPDVAAHFTDCDYLFLAADTNQARLVFNAIVHQYLIPGFQVGAKVPADRATGVVKDVFSVCRPVLPSSGCLWCNGLILSDGLQRETATATEQAAQWYVEDPEVVAPSVITLNATVAAQAANDFLFALTGLTRPDTSLDYMYFLPRRREVRFDIPRRDPACGECGVMPYSRFARGYTVSLPTRES
jgi:hypothetical protein